MESEQVLDYALRKTGIGSSEIAAICGLNPYMSAFDVYLEKTSKSDPREPTEAMQLGKRLEGAILSEYEKRTSKKVQKMFNETFKHPVRPWQLATPDGIVLEEARIVEAKNVGRRMAHFWGEEGTDAVPPYYLVQNIWQQSAMSMENSDMAALIAGDSFRIYSIPMDRELEEMLLERGAAFWSKNVLHDMPPKATDTERTQGYLKKRFARELGAMRPATAADMELIEEFRAAEKLHHAAEKTYNSAKVRLELAIGDDEGIEGPFGQVSWKSYASTRLDTKGIREEHPEIAAKFEKPSVSRRLLGRWKE